MEKEIERKIKCPMCSGQGEIEQPSFKQKLIQEKKSAAKKMKDEGYSYREISKALGYSSPRSAFELVNGENSAETWDDIIREFYIESQKVLKGQPPIIFNCWLTENFHPPKRLT